MEWEKRKLFSHRLANFGGRPRKHGTNCVNIATISYIMVYNPSMNNYAELNQKRENLLSLLRSYGRVAVAYSAGVDSTVVAQAAFLACGDQAVAVTASSDSLPQGELDAAVELAQKIGIRHVVLKTEEFSNPDYLRNAGDRCYHCKTELYTQIESRISELGVNVVVNGANLDDQGDYRPGMQAAREHAVRSPLIEAGLTKSDVRELARQWNLPVWDKPASPCLSSRIAYGLEVTPERVHRVDAAERFLKELLGIRELRVRHEAHDLARIEISVNDLPRLIDAQTRTQITSKLHELGFRFVTLDLEGFRSGSLNTALPLVKLTLGNS